MPSSPSGPTWPRCPSRRTCRCRPPPSWSPTWPAGASMPSAAGSSTPVTTVRRCWPRRWPTRADAARRISAYAYTRPVTFTVSIAGASGYAGGELLRLVSAHPELQLGPLAAGNRAGHPVTASHPQLVSLAGRSFVATDADTLGQADLVLMALPHGESAALVAALPADLPIVDLGADFRLADGGAWDRYYGSTPHAGEWAYGL